jgi:flagellin
MLLPYSLNEKHFKNREKEMSIINTNVTAMSAINQRRRNETNMSKSLEKMTSGQQINKAADNAAGLAISEKLRSEIKGLKQASLNAKDAVSVFQIADGGSQVIHDILGRMKTLMVQAANGTQQQAQWDAVGAEYEALENEIDRIANVTTFNQMKLLPGVADITLQVGAFQEATANTIAASTSEWDLNTTSLGLTHGFGTSGALSSTTTASEEISKIDAAASFVSSARGKMGALQNRMDFAISNIASQVENVTAAESRVRDADISEVMTDFTKNQVMLQASTSALANANQSPSLVLKLLG